MSIVIVAEKPSVARDIAKVVGAFEKHDGYIEGNGYQVTWAIGHLVGIAQPHEMQEKWKSWDRSLLPILPNDWLLKVGDRTKDQYKVVKRLLKSKNIDYAVCATDAGREGELIYRYIYEKSGAKCTTKRLWISSLTETSIKNGLANLYPLSRFDNLADSAKARSRSDWLVGMNLSRAYSTTYGENFSVGRVQTPTLSLIVDRELQITSFKSEKYLEIHAKFQRSPRQDQDDFYRATLINPISKKTLRFQADQDSQADRHNLIPAPTTALPSSSNHKKSDQSKKLDSVDYETVQASSIITKLKARSFKIIDVAERKIEVPPPFLFDLTELQRHANRMYGFSAKKTLEIAQQLYEQKKLISYPRTDSRHLSKDIEPQLASIVQQIKEPYSSILKDSTGFASLGKRFIDNSKVTDHHAIIPTGLDPKNLSYEQSVLYELICRRLLMAWQDHHIYATTTLRTASLPTANNSEVWTFQSRGKVIVQLGWKCLEGKVKPNKKQKTQPHLGSEDNTRKADRTDNNATQVHTLPSYIKKGLPVDAIDISPRKKQTTPPPRFNDATLLTAMETAGSCLDDKELSDAMRQKGLGTPATRSSIIETLIQREYTTREGKAFHALPKGIKLINIVHPEVRSPKMTGEWEWGLSKIQDGKESMSAFSQKISDHIADIVAKICEIQPMQRLGLDIYNPSPDRSDPGSTRPLLSQGQPQELGQTTDLQSSRPSSLISTKPNRQQTAPESLAHLLKNLFGFEKFRPRQEEVCRDVVSGHDTLLVMPTGAGKSLCYQLPGLAATGTTLVVSPLIALMEDQVGKMRELNLKASCMHSGNNRSTSRDICRDYLGGQLDFLFVAPERLGVPGFIEMLAKRKPTLIAIDEAHCISQWGHDFRPDYRMLHSRLERLRPTTIIATTATATPRVQQDIVKQLGLTDVKIHAHGFRRTNIMIEAVEISKGERISACLNLLQINTRLPAIIYAPTRKQAEECAIELSQDSSSLTASLESGGSSGPLRVGVYHAGMPSGKRSDVQSKFLDGRLDVVVATVAFGMGIDKSNVRMIIHLAFPGSIEGYYQEIGRAGRDGKISRAVLFYSYADIKTHEFFHRKNYPEPKVLQKILSDIGPQGCHRESIDSDVDKFELSSHIEKLWVHGAIKFDENDIAYLTNANWKTSYEAQRNHTASQFAEVSKYAENNASCRMLQLMSHFADKDAQGAPCRICDVCAPELSLLQTSRKLTAAELKIITMIMDATYTNKTTAAGTIYRSSLEKTGHSRQDFEKYINILIKENYLVSKDKTFTKNGRDIPFKVLHKTYKLFDHATITEIKIADLNFTPKKKPNQRSKKKAPASQTVSGYDQGLYEILRNWRLEESKRSRMPAFRVLGDRSLQEIALRKPVNEEQLLDVNGVGPAKFKKFGRRILGIIQTH